MYNHGTGDQFLSEIPNQTMLSVFVICSFCFYDLDKHAFSAYPTLYMKLTFHVWSRVISYLFMKPRLLYFCATELFCMV